MAGDCKSEIMPVSKIRVCPRCICLLAKLVDDDLIRKNEIAIKNALQERWPCLTEFLNTTLTDDGDICRCCVSALQDRFLDSVVGKVVNSFQSDGYICKSFKLSISLPVQSLLFMENALQTHNAAIDAIRCNGRGYSVKEIMKVYLEPILENQLSLMAMSKGDVDLDISLTLDHEESENDLLPQIAKQYPKCFSKARKQNQYASKKRARNEPSIFNATTISKVIETMTTDDLSSLINQTIFGRPIEIENIGMMRSPVYIGGRYLKMSRTLSQTPWFVGDVRISEMSVQEYITVPTQKLFQSESCNFSSSGREDIDVRMLGNGRPFIIEIINSRQCPTKEEISTLQNLINNSTDLIQIEKLTMVEKEDTKILKDGEEEKTKSYSSLCYTKISSEYSKENILEKLASLSSMENVKIKQKTPLRVLHRRNLAIREREIYSIHISAVSFAEVQDMASVDMEYSDMVVPFKLEITTQAGTYVKEFVHGDFNRTLPNLSTLIGSATDILCLDVTSVNVEWPPIKHN